jgi:hypothetical protein
MALKGGGGKTKDLVDDIAVRESIRPAGHAASVNGEIVDFADFESVSWIITTGAITDGTHTLKMQHGDESDLSDAADVAAADLIGSFPELTGTEDNKQYKVGYKGAKRYGRLVSTVAGATTGGIYHGTAVLGHARHKEEGPVT